MGLGCGGRPARGWWVPLYPPKISPTGLVLGGLHSPLQRALFRGGGGRRVLAREADARRVDVPGGAFETAGKYAIHEARSCVGQSGCGLCVFFRSPDPPKGGRRRTNGGETRLSCFAPHKRTRAHGPPRQVANKPQTHTQRNANSTRRSRVRHVPARASVPPRHEAREQRGA